MKSSILIQSSITREFLLFRRLCVTDSSNDELAIKMSRQSDCNLNLLSGLLNKMKMTTLRLMEVSYLQETTAFMSSSECQSPPLSHSPSDSAITMSKCGKKCICERANVLLSLTEMILRTAIHSFDESRVLTTLEAFRRVSIVEEKVSEIEYERTYGLRLRCHDNVDESLEAIHRCIDTFKPFRNEVLGMFISGEILEFFTQ